MSEASASFAVLGVDIELLGAAVARHWGLGEDVQLMIRRLPRDRASRTPEGDAEVLRTAASAANDAVDAVSILPATRVSHGLGLVAQRYARSLELGGVRELQEALQRARMAVRSGSAVSALRPERDDAVDPKPATDSDAAKPGDTVAGDIASTR
jgi:non-specific serine/threonine protein kinase